jgi:AcrR family transcriptional regulator
LAIGVKIFIVVIMENSIRDRRSRGRPRSFDRAAALETAMRLFWARGYEATSVAELAEAMGINPPSLYAAFGDKRRLFAEAVQRYRAGPGSFAAEVFACAASAREAVEGMLVRAAAAYADPARPPGCMVIHAGQNCARGDEEVAHALAHMRGEMESFIRARLEQGAAAGELPPDADTSDLAAFFAAVLQGMSTRARDGATTAHLEAIARRAMTAWPRGDEER